MKSVYLPLINNASAGASIQAIWQSITPRVNITIKKIFVGCVVKDSVTNATKNYEGIFEFVQTGGDPITNSIPGTTYNVSYNYAMAINQNKNLILDGPIYLKTGISYAPRLNIYCTLTATDQIIGQLILLYK